MHRSRLDYRSEACASGRLRPRRSDRGSDGDESSGSIEPCDSTPAGRINGSTIQNRKKWIATHPCCHHAVCRTCANFSKPSPPRKRTRSVPDEPQETRLSIRRPVCHGWHCGSPSLFPLAIAGCGSQAPTARACPRRPKSASPPCCRSRCGSGTISPAGSRQWKPSTSVRASAVTCSAWRTRKARKSSKGDLLFVIDPRPYRRHWTARRPTSSVRAAKRGWRRRRTCVRRP